MYTYTSLNILIAVLKQHINGYAWIFAVLKGQCCNFSIFLPPVELCQKSEPADSKREYKQRIFGDPGQIGNVFFIESCKIHSTNILI